MYSIRFDPEQRVFYLTLSGFWTVATVIQFAAEMLVRTTAARIRHGRYALVSDSTEFAIQSPAVSAHFERIMARGIEMDVGPSAIIVGSYLNKLQAERIFDGDRVRVFLDSDAATAWLASVWPPAATA